MNGVPLNIDWQQILLHLFNFAILAGGLYFILYKPVKKFMEQRDADYENREAAVAEKENKAAETLAEIEARKADLAKELEAEREAALDKVKAETALRISEAEEKKAQIIADAKTAAEADKNKMIAEAREEIIDLASKMAEKILKEEA